MKLQMICVENNELVMTDPRIFTSFDQAEIALAKRMMFDDKPETWSLTYV